MWALQTEARHFLRLQAADAAADARDALRKDPIAFYHGVPPFRYVDLSTCLQSIAQTY